MRKIKNGKLYDTDTATEICSGEDYDNDKLTLYRKQNGEYFIGITCCYEEDYFRVRPLKDYSEAKSFVEDHAPIETYIRFFGEVSE